MTTDYERAFAFQKRVMERTSTREERLPWGTAFFHDGFPLRYDANMAIVDRALAGANADDVVAMLDELYGGFRHREVEFASVDDADSIAMGMVEHGYAVEHMVVMAHRRDPDREPELDAVEELGFEELEPFFADVTRREPWGGEPGIAEMLASFRRVLVEGVGARFFAQRVDGALAGSCELYVEGDVAQIEDVNTIEEFRGRGIARNVVLRAAEEARKAGASFVFLFADAQDWPRHLYGRLGFDPIGHSRLFTRWPHDQATRDAKSPAVG
ncbi:MAG: GNAT family N-acetyltransferase [Actinomycetota bacterium]